MYRMFIDKRKLYLQCAKQKIGIKELVAKAGLTYQVIVAINKGFSSNSKTVGSLAEALNVSPEALLKDEV